jgi:hypothetical protein
MNRCPMCIDQIRRDVVKTFNGQNPGRERQRALLAAFDVRVDAITFTDHTGLHDHLISEHRWRPYTGTLRRGVSTS